MLLDARGLRKVLWIGKGAAVALRHVLVTGGAGIANRGTLTLIDTVVVGNTVRNGSTYVGLGGGISNAGTLTLIGLVVRGNTSTAHGGGIDDPPSGTVTLTDSVVRGNRGLHSGGGIENWGVATLKGSVVRVNRAWTGGGIWNLASGGVGPGTLVLLGGTSVSGNTARYRGGGTDNLGGTVTLRGESSVSANTAGTRGGGIFNTGTVTLRGGSSVSTGCRMDGTAPTQMAMDAMPRGERTRSGCCSGSLCISPTTIAPLTDAEADCGQLHGALPGAA